MSGPTQTHTTLMKNNITSLIVAGSMLACVVLLAFNVRAGEAAVNKESEHGLLVERGRYLVNSVGLCADCHTPRNERGEFVQELWLEGAALGFAPTVPMPWAPAAPPIAGLRAMTDDEAKTFLTTGVRPNGTKPLPPMPEYRFSESDAEAVVAYLRTLSK
jgi:Cytochrome c.